MDLATIIGVVMGISLVTASIMTGGDIGGFINIPSILVVFGGTFSGTLIMFPMGQVIGSIKVAINTIKVKPNDPKKIIKIMVELSKKVRKDGALSLQTYKTPDKFLSKAIGMMVDGMDHHSIRAVLGTEIDKMKARHASGSELFDQVGLLAPAFGMIGTLIGLVQMLQQLSDPASIGPAMAVALLTTFYGALLANLFCIPIAKKLSIRSTEESVVLELIMEGVVSIVRKENPSLMRSKLNAFLVPSQQVK